METTITELTPEAAALTEEMKKVQFTLNGIQFNPYQHFVDLKGKIYLPVAWRLAWFRAARPKGKIRTEIIEHDKEAGFILIKAYIDDEEGGESEAYGSCTRAAFKDYIEKAETKAKGRALADLGYGTQFAEELDEDDALADSPLDRGNNKPSVSNQRPAPAAANNRPVTRQQPPASANATAASQPAAGTKTAKAVLWEELDKLKPVKKNGQPMTRPEALAYVFRAAIQNKQTTVEHLIKTPEYTEDEQMFIQEFIDQIKTERAAKEQSPAA